MRINPISNQSFTALTHVIVSSPYEQEEMIKSLQNNSSCQNGRAFVLTSDGQPGYGRDFLYVTGQDAQDYEELKDAALESQVCSENDFDSILYSYLYKKGSANPLELGGFPIRLGGPC